MQVFNIRIVFFEEIIFNEELDSELKDKALREQNQNNIDLEKR